MIKLSQQFCAHEERAIFEHYRSFEHLQAENESVPVRSKIYQRVNRFIKFAAIIAASAYSFKSVQNLSDRFEVKHLSIIFHCRYKILKTLSVVESASDVLLEFKLDALFFKCGCDL